ncbi:MAG: hypothetical protein ABIQ55_00115, partial [Gemmatimonadaceae bacterium]
LLVVAAGLAALPVIAGAQTPTDTTMKKDTMMMKDTMMKDTMMMMKDTMMKDTMMMMKDTMTMMKDTMTKMSTPMATTTSTAATSALPAESTNGARPVPPSDGMTCPWGCPTSKGVAGLSGPQFLALQQELRDKGCGKVHVTGKLDGPTRRAIAICARKMGVANSAKAVLVAANIGYSDADVMGKMEE